MKDFTFPSITVWEKETYRDNYGKFIIEPLERGYGVTIGNTLRRVLLSSISGIAITGFRVDGVMHEFSTIEGVKEDVVEIAMNLKQVALKANVSEFPHQVEIELTNSGARVKTLLKSIEELGLSGRIVNTLNQAGIDTLEKLLNTPEPEVVQVPGLGKKSVEEIVQALSKHNLILPGEDSEGEGGQFAILAGDLIPDGSAEVINKDLHIATANSDKKLRLDLEITQGRGYVPLNKLKLMAGEKPLGTILLDGIYSPVKKVTFNVENTRVGQFVDYEKVILELWTNGAISPEEALKEATDLINRHYSIIVAEQKLESAEEMEQEDEKEPDLDIPIEELKLSTRVNNALKLKNIKTLRQLLETPKESFADIKNLGRKSVEEIEEALIQRGYTLKTEEELNELKKDM